MTEMKVNPNEARVLAALEKDGFNVLRGGWPDFLAINRDGRVMAIEVKAGSDKVSARQLQMHAALQSVGVPVYVLRADALTDRTLCKGLEPVNVGRAIARLDKLSKEVEQIRKDLGGPLVLAPGVIARAHFLEDSDNARRALNRATPENRSELQERSAEARSTANVACEFHNQVDVDEETRRLMNGVASTAGARATCDDVDLDIATIPLE